jgi:hypothetical protein
VPIGLAVRPLRSCIESRSFLAAAGSDSINWLASSLNE